MKMVNGDQQFDMTWTDNSDIEEGFYQWRSNPTGDQWINRPGAGKNVTSATVSFNGKPYPSGSVFKYKLQAYNWRDESQEVEASFKVP